MRAGAARPAMAGILVVLALALPGAPAPQGAVKTARSRSGMVAASTPYAAAAGAKVLAAGGNAVDAAVAAAFALAVTDPPMTSLGGRVQMLIVLRDGRAIGIDGATQVPANMPPLERGHPRSGYQVVPVPGNPAALALAVKQYGRLSLAKVLQPAIELAEKGFGVTPRVADIWAREADRLGRNPGARLNYLKPDGSPYKGGEVFRHPRLAQLFRTLARSGPEKFYRGAIAAAMVRDVREHGGFLGAADLRDYQPEAGAVVRTTYRNCEVLTLGRHAWGNTLAEMLNILGHFSISRGEPAAPEVELMARTIAQALDDRPQVLGSLAPKREGYPLDLISSREFARERAERIRRRLEESPVPGAETKPVQPPEGDTTHVSVMDAEGNAVALTTSVGPHFGARVVTPELGFSYAHSYRMESGVDASGRDLTEMTPTIVLRDGRPWVAIGAAGSERIPAAILQVLSNLLDRGYGLEKAVAAPRVFCVANRLRIQDEFPAATVTALRGRRFEVEIVPREFSRHVGIVQAVLYDPASGEYVGAADPVYDGAAAAPQRLRTRRR